MFANYLTVECGHFVRYKFLVFFAIYGFVCLLKVWHQLSLAKSHESKDLSTKESDRSHKFVCFFMTGVENMSTLRICRLLWTNK